MNARAADIPLQRWPLVAQPSNRSESWTKDARLVNAFAEKDPNTGEWIVQKRIGYSLDYSVPNMYANGMYSYAWQWGAAPNVYSIFTDGSGAHATMYKDGAVFGAPIGIQGYQAGQNYFFVEDNANPHRHLIFGNGLTIYYADGYVGTWTAPTLPSHGKIVGLAYLDQTIYCMDVYGTIFNSAFNDPSTWSGSQVTANAIPGDGIALVSQLNYVIALKTNSMEVFYDAANPPPGSPLSPVPGALSNYGCVLGTAQVIDDLVFFCTSNRTVSPQVVRLDNLQVRIVSVPPVEKMLDQIPVVYTSVTVVSSWTFKHGGHRFYGITFQGTSTQPGFTLVYDIDQNLWYQWTDQYGNYWPVNAMAADGLGRHVLQGMLDGNVYLFEGDYEYPTDNGIVSPVEIYTPNTDFGTRKHKILSKMYFNTDQTPGSILYVSRSDDDYQTWSIPRRVDLSKKRPEMRNEGTFTRRAYHFRHVSPTPLRIRSVDLLMKMGVS